MTPGTVAGTEHWREGYGWTETETSPAVTVCCFLGKKKGWEGQQTPRSKTKSQIATVQVLAETGLSTSCLRAGGNSTTSLSTRAGTRK